MMNLTENLRRDLVLIEEDPDGEYRRLPSWVAQEFDEGCRATIMRALARFGGEADQEISPAVRRKASASEIRRTPYRGTRRIVGGGPRP
jgi:hypothetical protein